MQKVHHATWLDILNPDIVIDDKFTLGVIESNTTSALWNEITFKYMQGNITRKRFFRDMLNLYQGDYEQTRRTYQSKVEKIETKYSKGTPWSFWKRFFIVFETFLLFLSLLGYFYLYIRIKNRVYNQKKI